MYFTAAHKGASRHCRPLTLAPGGSNDDAVVSGPEPIGHVVRIGDRTLILDLVEGAACELDDPRREVSRLERRLLLLDWTRKRVPVLTPTACWNVEAALLAARIGDPDWETWAAPGLAPAVRTLLRSPLPEPLMTTFAAIGDHVDGGEPVAADLLQPAVEALAAFFQDREIGPSPLLGPVRKPLVGCAEPVWDQLPWGQVAVTEHSLRSRVFSTVWTASVAAGPAHRESEAPDRLWARLVDKKTGETFDQVEMSLADGVYVARGFVPLPARARAVRVDLTDDVEAPALSDVDLERVLAEQQLFRAQVFERRADVDERWRDWAEVHGRTGVRRTGEEYGPFLAELLLRPELLASSCHCPAVEAAVPSGYTHTAEE